MLPWLTHLLNISLLLLTQYLCISDRFVNVQSIHFQDWKTLCIIKNHNPAVTSMQRLNVPHLFIRLLKGLINVFYLIPSFLFVLWENFPVGLLALSYLIQINEVLCFSELSALIGTTETYCICWKKQGQGGGVCEMGVSVWVCLFLAPVTGKKAQRVSSSFQRETESTAFHGLADRRTPECISLKKILMPIGAGFPLKGKGLQI